ncbi:hypothetical protein LCGC14_1366800 [marine sediment metagenome]|uniref:Uncharacterized protein n=1 Tax=marine sediment metagenome TaxID=412755 RepID=A0A0F9K722_9ZZZZ
MAEIKSLSSIREKWARVTPGRTEDYRLGIMNPKRDWAEESLAAKDNYKLGVDKAHSNQLYEKGVRAAGSAKWKDKALKKGPGRFAEGVMVGAQDYEKGFAPYRDAIESVDLGPRFPKRDPRNIDRVKRIVDALIEKKIGG